MAGAATSTAAWREVLALFDRWAAADAAQREATLQQVQRDHPELYPRLLAMIDADRVAEARDFLGGDASALNTLAADSAEARWAGTRLGDWELRESIGQGGMGQVWLATRSDGLYSGRAAVKLLHAASMGAQAQARFAREGELLARLSHPHIAQLLDAGLTAHGTRYLVLEYVQGERIDHWCDTRKLGIAARLRLFMQVCDAVAYAHAHLVVHRDLKPANILVSDDGHVKLLDFGVAKLLSGDGTGEQPAELTELTKAGAAGLTPEYAAPEQVEGQAITTATDAYALGVVLFGLLSGARPYGNPSRGVAAMARAIVEEPPRSLTAALRASPDAATSRGSSLPALEQAVRGDLETIVAKALKKKPEERYATVQELREDLQRHLDHQPVRAQPDTFGYRARKFTQRNRVQVIAIAGVMLSLLVGIVATTWQWRAATAETERTRSVLKVLTDIFTDLTPDESGTAQVPVIDLLRKGWGQVQQSLKDNPELQGEVARPLGLMLGSSGDMANAIAALTVARTHLVASGQTRTKPYLQVLQSLSYAQSRVGQSGQARRLLNEIIEVSARMGDASVAESVNAQVQLGDLSRREGQLTQARELLARAAETARTRLGPKHELYVLALLEQSDLLRELGLWTESKRLLAEIVAATHDSKPNELLIAKFNQGVLDVELGNYRDGARRLREITRQMVALFGPGDTFSIYSGVWLATALFHSGEVSESDAAIAAAHAAAKASTEPNVKHTVQTVLARQLVRRGRCVEALPLLRENVEHFEAAGSTGRPFAERSRLLLGECQLRAGQAAPALATLAEVLRQQRAFYGERHLDLWPTLLLQAIATESQRGSLQARAGFEEACAMALAMLPPEHPDRLKAQVFRDRARWRGDQSAASRQVLSATLAAYAAALKERPDSAAFHVLSNELLDEGPAASSTLAPLLALLIY